MAQPDQGGSHRAQGALWILQIHPQVRQQHIQCRFTIEMGHHMTVMARDGAGRGNRLAPLRDPGDQAHVRAKRHPAEAPKQHRMRGGLSWIPSPLRQICSTTGQATKHLTALGGLSQLLDQLGQIGRLTIGMDQGGVGPEPLRQGLAQGRHAAEHAVILSRQIQQHHTQCGLIKILDTWRTHAHTHRPRPIADPWQLGLQLGQDLLGMSGVMVGQVDQAQGRLIGIVGLIQLCAQLRDHQAGGHGPLGMRGMAVGEQLHFFGLERLRVGFEGAAAGAVAATASALRCMSFMASPAIC